MQCCLSRTRHLRRRHNRLRRQWIEPELKELPVCRMYQLHQRYQP
jgi:hypothetical protein